MGRSSLFKAAGVSAAFIGIVLTGMAAGSRPVGARSEQTDDQKEESKIRRGFEIAPVQLNLQGKNRALVGLGSYIVNAVGDCNGCHSAGPQTELVSGGSPYQLSPPFTGKTQINTATYLGGGRDFGPYVNLPHLYSRNLTPDRSGLPIGGHSFEEFVEIMREGTDFDQVHPPCTGPGTPANCLAPPFNGNVLQVMRWPFFKSMTDRDLRAIYEYLSAVPCNPGRAIAGAPYLQNVCE